MRQEQTNSGLLLNNRCSNGLGFKVEGAPKEVHLGKD
jgi:hypothetical protein